MSAMRLLLVEDEASALEACRNSVDRYRHERSREIEVVEYKTFEDALGSMENSFDGAIIDLKLGDHEDGGTQLILRIEESLYRLPVFILTAFPNNLDEDFARINQNVIGVVTKGTDEAEYVKLLDRLWSIYDTGLTRIMGGRGTIEENLRKVFSKNLLPHIETWESYGRLNSNRTEKALLRYTLNHLSSLLDDDEENCFPEEVYLVPPLAEDIRTGSVVKEKQSGRNFVVMNPACDLVKRADDSRNAERILVAEIDLGTERFPWFGQAKLSRKKRERLESAFRNSKSSFHWLPEIACFKGGFLNFQKLATLEESEFFERFETPPRIQIAPSFVKDIIARFSSYYARQGQPDIDYSEILSVKSGNND